MKLQQNSDNNRFRHLHFLFDSLWQSVAVSETRQALPVKS